ncbi:endoplasmic reticulum metallopeptidase 1-like [Ostrinia nubilalis]|uniref:endoplasmic reticulum metallopeptidase 1-like n=1 Tax=Ostrinia nubilalis TaxID=29057 RepID=UPI0030825D2F
MSAAGDEFINLKSKKGSFLNTPRAYSGLPTDEYNEKGDEKPWQRVLYEITRKGIHLYEPVKSVPSILIIVLLGLYLLLGFLTQLIEDDMPRVVQEVSIGRDDWQTFSEESAQRYLTQILGGQPRVAGTEFHLQKTRDLLDLLNGVAAQARLTVKTDWQLVTGDYFLNFSVPFVNYYQNVSNIVALLEGETGFHSNGTLGPALLLNCHYDSVPFAQGASDNGVFCAVMVEVLSRLSRRTTKFKHNILFLFNGAEENPLQGSHAFLHHPWSKAVTAVVNLDAAGMNGKPSVFQVTDPRILRAYERGTPRPSAQAVGEFLFTSGIIPSDTDFRIWRDFGDIQGIDIAFSKGGQVYHTRNDRPELILPGVIQNAGNMLLHLVAEAADMDLQDKATATQMVYFDFYNLFMVSISRVASHILDAFVALLALLSVAYYIWLVGCRWSTVQELLWAAAGRTCCLVGGVVIVAVLVPIMVATTVQMRYISNPWIAVPMFWLPYMVGTIAVAHAFDAWRTKKSGLNRSIRALQAMAATRFILAVILIVMACIPAATSVRYVISVPLFMTTMASFVSMTCVRYVRLQGWQHLLLEFVLSIPAVMFMFVLSLRLDSTLFPIMGRSAGNSPDYTVAVVNVGMAVITCVTVSGVELLFSRKRVWMPLTAVMLASMVCMFLPLSPYHEDGVAVQRHYWLHSELVTYDEQKQATSRTSGVFVTKMDPYTTQRVLPAFSSAGIQLNSRTDFEADCQSRLYCGLPLYRVAMGQAISQGLFMYTGAPAAFSPAPDVALANKTCAGELCTYHFVLTVAPHNVIILWPRANISISSWSFSSPVEPAFTQNGRPVYIVMHSVATYSQTFAMFEFTLVLNVPTSLQSGPALDFCDQAHLIQHPQVFTAEYRRLLEAAPKYFNVASVLTIRSDYVF